MPSTKLTTIVHLQHADATGGDLQWFDASDGDAGLSPRSVQYVPCIVSELPELAETMVDGLENRKPVVPPAVSVTFARWKSGVDRLAVLDGRILMAQSAMIGAVGTGGDGTVYTSASPKAWADGEVLSVVSDSDHMVISIGANQRLWQREIPRATWWGYRSGLLYDGVNDKTVVTGYSTVPASLTLLAGIIIPRLWDVAGSNTQDIASAFGFRVYLSQTSSYKVTLSLSYSTDAGGSLATIIGPEFVPEERAYALVVKFNTATLEARFGVDGSYTDVTGVTAYVAAAPAEDWQMGMYRSNAATALSTILGPVLLFGAIKTDADLAPLHVQPADGSESDLVFMFSGESLGAVLFEYADVNAEAPLDGAISGATSTSFFEGPAELAGNYAPLVFQARNLSLTPVDGPRNVMRATRHPYTISDISAFYDGGVPLTRVPTTSLKEFATTTPLATEVVLTEWGGGLAKVADFTDNTFTVDVLGASLWPGKSLALGNDYSGARVDFPLSLNTAIDANNRVALELWFEHGPDGDSAGSYAFTSHWLAIGSVSSVTPNVPETRMSAAIESTDPTKVIEIEWFMPPHTVHAVRVEAWEDGADLKARVLVGGTVIGTGTVVGEGLATDISSEKSTLSAPNTLFFTYNHMAALPLRVWDIPSPTTRTDADAEADHREFMFENPAVDATNLIAMYTDHQGDMAVLLDDTANNHDGTIVNGGTEGAWRPGIMSASPLESTIKVLRDFGDVDMADVTISGDAWGIPAAPQDLLFERKIKKE